MQPARLAGARGTIPPGARRTGGGEIDCFAEEAVSGYDNPVYIDNLVIRCEP